MARSVDRINITNVVDTGLTTSMKRYTFTLEIQYTDNNGVSHTYGPTDHTFPNDLASMPLANQKYFATKMVEAFIRVQLGIDTWEKYR